MGLVKHSYENEIGILFKQKPSFHECAICTYGTWQTYVSHYVLARRIFVGVIGIRFTISQHVHRGQNIGTRVGASKTPRLDLVESTEESITHCDYY